MRLRFARVADPGDPAPNTRPDSGDPAPIADVVMAHAYDLAGNRTQLAATIGTMDDFVNDYSYDNLHRMTGIQQHSVIGSNAVADKRIDFAYDAAGQWQTIKRYEDLTAATLVAQAAYTFDNAGRLTDLAHSQPGGVGTLAGYSWTFDGAGRVTQFESVLDGTVTYSCDNTDQLTGADYDYQSDETYSYDANGNRTNTGHTTGTNNQLSSDGTYNYEYDAEGNRTLRVNIATGESTEYTWDRRNRLTKIVSKKATDAVTKTIDYTYDIQNRRVGKVISPAVEPAETEHFIYEGDRPWQRHAGDNIVFTFCTSP